MGETTSSSAAGQARQELILTRIYGAPRSLVFKAWTDARHMARWWGPRGFTNPVCEVDVCPGGLIRIDMRGPDGTTYPMKGVFQEIRELERLVFTSTALEDEHGKPLLEILNTVTFDDFKGITKLTLHAVLLQTAQLGLIQLVREICFSAHLCRTEARSCSLSVRICRTSAWLPVSSCRAAQSTISASTGARSMPLAVKV